MGPDLWELFEDGNADDEVAAIIRLGHYGVLPKAIRVVTQFSEIVTVRMKRRDVIAVSGAPEVASMAAGDAYLGADVESEFSGDLSENIQPSDERRPKELAHTGRDVVVGVVDWGFDFAHADFRNKDGSTRILALWDQRGSRRPASPEPFGYGIVHDRDAINRALQSKEPYAALGYHPADADTGIGCHGTHVASIAAGSGGDDRPAGIAPEADLVLVHNAPWDEAEPSKLGDSVTLLEGIDFISQTAGTRPWVINLSMGRHGEQHDGSTLIEQGLDAAIRSTPGRAICLSAGNYYDKKVHASGQLRPTQERTLIWEILEGKPTYNQMEFWYSWQDKFELSLRSPDGNIAARVKVGERAKLLLGGKEVGNVYHRSQEPNNLDSHITIYLYREAPPGEWQVTLVGTDVIDGRYHAWIERDVSCPRCQSRFRPDDADTRSTTGTICNGRRTIAVGAYDFHDPDRRIGRFSSVGPTRDGRLKPDLCAPGVSVLAARSAQRNRTDTPLLTRMSGTSMASPHVAGTVALMFQASRRRLRIEETHNLLLEHATRIGESVENPDRYGIGFLDIVAVVEAASKVSGAGTAFTQKTIEAPALGGRPQQGSEQESFREAESSEIVEAYSQAERESESESEMEHAIPNAKASTAEIDADAESETVEQIVETCGCQHKSPSQCETEAQETESFPWQADAADSMTDFAEFIDQIGSERSAIKTSITLVQEFLEHIGKPDALFVGHDGSELTAADLFDAFAFAGRGVVRETIKEHFEVIALPGTELQRELREGDLMIRRLDGDTAHLAFVANPRLQDLNSVVTKGLTPETLTEGNFIHIAEAGVRPHARSDQFARRLTDAEGNLLNDILLLRLASPPTVVNVQQPSKTSSDPDAETVRGIGAEGDDGISSLPSHLASAVHSGTVTLQVALAILSGQRDPDLLANLVFYSRHPEFPVGRKIQPQEHQLVQDWLHIREQVIKPLLQMTSSNGHASVVTAANHFLGVDFGDVDENHNPDWTKAKTEGPLSFAIIRAHTGWRQDHDFAREWSRMKDAGIVRGAYLFLSYPSAKWGKPPLPAAQAEAFIKVVGGLERGDFPPTLDVEFPGSWTATGMSRSQLLESVRSAWKALKDHYGVAPIIYTSARVWREDLGDPDTQDLLDSPLWLTPYPFGTKGIAVRNPEAFAPGGRYHPPPVPTPWGAGNWWIHQYQGDAHGFPGFRQIDVNRFNVMANGATGQRVKWVQRRLGIVQSGIFDGTTEEALKRFQSRQNLATDGVIDPRTFASLCWANPSLSSQPLKTARFGEAVSLTAGRVPDTDVPCPRPATILDQFEKNKAVLRPPHFPIIVELARKIVASQKEPDPIHSVCIEGHTDKTGARQFNQNLGKQRAEAVETELLRQIAALSPGLERLLSIFAISAGADEPIASNDTAEGRARNRRAEVFLNNRFKPSPQTGSVRIDLPSTPGRSVAEAAFSEDQDTTAPAVFLVDDSQEWKSTGNPLPVGNPAYFWTSRNPEVALVSLVGGDFQAHPSRALVRGVKPGETEIQVVYTSSSGARPSIGRKVVMTGIEVSLLDPPGHTCSGANELVRPLQRTEPAHRTIRFTLEPKAFWAGKSVRLSFRVNGVQRGALGGLHSANLEAVPGFRFNAADGTAVLTANGTTAIRVNMPVVPLNAGTLDLVSPDFPFVREQIEFEVPGRVVIDPGHGGNANLPASSQNNATSVSGVLEKAMTLDMGLKVRDGLNAQNHVMHATLTRDDDFNVAGADRAHVAQCQHADTFVSIHFNGDANAAVRGTEVFVRANTNGNVNRDEDVQLANRINAAIVAAIPGGNSRGVRDDTATRPGSLAVLNDASLGNTAAEHPVRACLAEIEFITNRAVDQLLNGANKEAARTRIANAIAGAIVTDLLSR